MNKQKLNKAIKNSKITVTEIQSDIYTPYIVGVVPRPRTDYSYTIHISHLSSDDMMAFMHWFKEVNPNWLEGIEQGYDDGWGVNNY